MKNFIKSILVVFAIAGVCYLSWWSTGLSQKFGDFNYLNWLGVVLIVNVLNPNNKIKQDDAEGH